MSNATKFRTETAEIAAANGWTLESDNEQIDRFVGDGLVLNVNYTVRDYISFATLHQGGSVVSSVEKGSAGKLAAVRELLAADIATELEGGVIEVGGELTLDDLAEISGPRPTPIEVKQARVVGAEYADMTKAELLELAKTVGLVGRSRMSKAELVRSLDALDFDARLAKVQADLDA